MREMDLIMGRFADREIAGLDDGDLDTFEALLEEADDEVYGWLTGRTLPPERFDTPLLSRLRSFEHAAHVDLA